MMELPAGASRKNVANVPRITEMPESLVNGGDPISLGLALDEVAAVAYALSASRNEISEGNHSHMGHSYKGTVSRYNVCYCHCSDATVVSKQRTEKIFKA
jgi:hypothetical protein